MGIMTVCQVHFLPGTTVSCRLPLGIDWQAYRNPRESKNKIVSCTAQTKSAVLHSWVNSEQLAELALNLHQWKQRKTSGVEFVWLEPAVLLWTLLSVEGKPHLRVLMVILSNIPRPAFSLVVEFLLFRSNNLDFFSSKSMGKKVLFTLPHSM